MTFENLTTGWLRADAVISCLLALPGLVNPDWVMSWIGAEDPVYGFLVRLWSGLLFLFGCMSFEASRDVVGRATLRRYVWIGKAIVAATVLAGHLGGEVPPAPLALVMLTNLPWIAVLLHAQVVLRTSSSR